eukprot:TRINITY_DN74_c0_g2_i1.p1 TRINITY_DN74_c0_g2~~TRINITY_DN74_c0_g2_i1.p1  ORF type:complete len:834 (-),score=175.52 TRINITY_DN74_c0_g2_i1:1255-3756(-)
MFLERFSFPCPFGHSSTAIMCFLISLGLFSLLFATSHNQLKYAPEPDPVEPLFTPKGCISSNDGDVMCHVEDGDTCPVQVMFSDDSKAFSQLPHTSSFDGCKGLVFSEVDFESDYSNHNGIHRPPKNKSTLRLNENIRECGADKVYYMTEPYPTDNWCLSYKPELSDAFMCPLPEKQRKLFPLSGAGVGAGPGVVELDDSVRFVGVQCGDRVNIHMRHVHDHALSARKRKRISEVFKDIEEKPCASFGETSDHSNQSADGSGKCYGVSDTTGPPNVLILIIDTVSRNAFRRQAAHTMRFLKKYAGIDMMPSYPELHEKEFLSSCDECGEELGPTVDPIDSFDSNGKADDGNALSKLGFDPNAIEWFNAWKYNVVGSNTSPNLNAFISAIPSPELPQVHKSDGKRENLLYFFQNLGYIIGFSGHQASHDRTDKINHDHYYSFFGDMGFETRTWSNLPRAGEPSRVQFGPGSSDLTQHCYGGVRHHSHSMRIIDQVFSDYKGIPKFFIEHHTDNHVYRETGIVLEDRDLALHLARLPLNNTVLVLMGDHGKPNDQTKRGRYEHMNPLLMIAWPKYVLDRFPSSRNVLSRNEFRLLTVMDLYRTLRNMVRPFLREEVSATIDWQSRMGYFHPGINILESEIPLNRKCEEALIPSAYCPCVQWKAYSKNDLKLEHQKKLIQTFYHTLVLKGMQMEDGISVSGSGKSQLRDDIKKIFTQHCYVDHADHSDHVDQRFVFRDSDFDIESFQSIVSLESLKKGEKIVFRTSFVGNVVRSPEGIIPLFAVVGEGCLDGTCPILMTSIVRMSLYQNEPCILDLGSNNDIIPYCICKSGTEFSR